MKFLQYLTEGRTQRIPEPTAIRLIKTHCKKNYKYLFEDSRRKIYRGVHESIVFGYIDTNKGRERVSANTLNYTTLLMDNLPSWNGWPKRSRSVICSTSWSNSDSYGNLYHVIPYDNSKIGICSEYDVWDSFTHLRYGVNSFNTLFEKLFLAYKINTNDKNWNTFVKSLQELQSKFNPDTLPKDEEYYFEKYESIIDILFNGKNIIINLDNMLDPEFNNFKMGIKNLNEEREVFIQGECILISEDKHSLDSIKKLMVTYD